MGSILFPDDPILTRAQAAEYLGITAQTLANWHVRKIGPRMIRYSTRTVRYRKSDLDNFLADRIVLPNE